MLKKRLALLILICLSTTNLVNCMSTALGEENKANETSSSDNHFEFQNQTKKCECNNSKIMAELVELNTKFSEIIKHYDNEKIHSDDDDHDSEEENEHTDDGHGDASAAEVTMLKMLQQMENTMMQMQRQIASQNNGSTQNKNNKSTNSNQNVIEKQIKTMARKALANEVGQQLITRNSMITMQKSNTEKWDVEIKHKANRNAVFSLAKIKCAIKQELIVCEVLEINEISS